MSDQFDSFTSPIKKEIVELIEKLDLSTLQKLHLKLLAHCLEIFKDISSNNGHKFPSELSVQNWCIEEAKKLNDEDFASLLNEQMNSAAIKLSEYGEKIGKNPLELNLDDLVGLISHTT